MEDTEETGNDTGSVIHESIADAARTRHMWQQRAAQYQQTDAQPRRSTTPTSIRWSRSTANGNHEQIVNDNIITRNGSIHRDQPRPTTLPMDRPVSQAYTNGLSSPLSSQRTLSGHQTALSPQTSLSLQTRQHQQLAASPSDQKTGSEKRLFMAYVLSHLDTVTSVGITVPWSVRQQYQKYTPPANVKVELMVVGGRGGGGSGGGSGGAGAGPGPGIEGNEAWTKYSVNERSSSVGPRESHQSGQFDGSRSTPSLQSPQRATGRYIKNGVTTSNGSTQSTANGWQKKLSRRQSQNTGDGSNGPSGTTGSNATIRPMSRQGKGSPGTDEELRSPKSVGEHGYSDDAGNMYRSLGESIIAREIREYREREEELRRSRSELGLPSLEEMMDNWKENNVGTGENGHNGRAQSLDRLQASVLSERISRTSIPSQNGRPSSQNIHPTAGYDQSASLHGIDHLTNGQNNARNDYERLLLTRKESSASKGPRNKPQATQRQPVNFDDGRVKSDTDFVPVEARIEQEMEELRRREEELRTQREAAGLYTLVGMQPSPLASSSPTDFAIVSNRYGDKPSQEYVTNIGGRQSFSQLSVRTIGSTVSPAGSGSFDDSASAEHAPASRRNTRSAENEDDQDEPEDQPDVGDKDQLIQDRGQIDSPRDDTERVNGFHNSDMDKELKGAPSSSVGLHVPSHASAS